MCDNASSKKKKNKKKIHFSLFVENNYKTKNHLKFLDYLIFQVDILVTYM